jgi:hypothetical protein
MTKPDDWKKEYLSLLNRSGSDGTESIRADCLKKQYLPTALYRYRHFDPQGHSLSSLCTDTTWLSSPLDFNDPFDSSLSISWRRLSLQGFNDYWEERVNKSPDTARLFAPEEIETIRNADNKFDAFTKIALKKDRTIAPKKKGVVNDSLLSAVGNFLKKQMQGRLSSLKDSLRICCFSEQPDSILMWSHYAQDHKGFCVEYSAESLRQHDAFFRLLQAARRG